MVTIPTGAKACSDRVVVKLGICLEGIIRENTGDFTANRQEIVEHKVRVNPTHTIVFAVTLSVGQHQPDTRPPEDILLQSQHTEVLAWIGGTDGVVSDFRVTGMCVHETKVGRTQLSSDLGTVQHWNRFTVLHANVARVVEADCRRPHRVAAPPIVSAAPKREVA